MDDRFGSRSRTALTTLCGGLLGAAVALPVMAQGVSITTQARLENQEPQNWLHVHRDYDGHRYTPLTQINLDTIRKLELAYSFALPGVDGGGSRYANAQLEGTPVVEDGFMYFPTGWGVVYKMDVTNRSMPKPVWVMDPQIDKPWAADVACCGVNNRGVALWRDKVISIALDGRLFATNKSNGEVAWERKVADPAVGETLTVGPLVVKDVAIIGPAGAEYGIRGWIDATDLNTGEQVWRTYTVAGPDDPVGGPTWVEPGTYETGGGSIWVTGTYDPALNLTYWGTGNPGPDWDAEYRPGDNLYTDSVLALNADNGNIEWFFQYTPNDPYDYDEIGEHPIVDVEIDGEMRRVVTHSGRNGYYYGFDAANGTFLYGKQYTRDMSWTPGLDPKTGKPLAYDPNKTVQAYVTGATPQRGNQGGTVCPIHTGGKNWEPSAYDPVRKTAYILGGEGCNQRITAVQEKPEWQGGTWKHRDRFVGGGGPQEPFPPANPAWPVEERGAITAVDAATGEVKKKVMLDYFNRSGVMASAGGFVMFGDFEGWVQARNSDTLDLVWRFNVGSAIKGPPMSFESNGVQYIAILVGSATGSTQNRVNPALAFYAPAYSLYVFRLDSDLLAPI